MENNKENIFLERYIERVENYCVKKVAGLETKITFLSEKIKIYEERLKAVEETVFEVGKNLEHG
jgi:hypothetical protein